MANTGLAQQQSSNFALKHEYVSLVPTGRTSVRTDVSVRDLESMRVEQAFVPASKHGLETICGASCETGAQ
jgi:hypothetical protein